MTTSEEAIAAFGFDIRGAGILPVQVIFDNTGNHPLEILSDKTLLVDEENNLWPILDERMAYDRLSKKTELGKVAPEAAKGGLLAGAAGAVIGAAIGIVTGRNVAAAAGKGAAVGAAAGITMGGAKGLSDSDVQYQIQEDLQKRTLERRAVAPHEVAHGFIFFPGEAKEAEGTPDQHPGDGYQAGLSADPEILTGSANRSLYPCHKAPKPCFWCSSSLPPSSSPTSSPESG